MGAIGLSVFSFAQNDSIQSRWFAAKLKPNYTASYDIDDLCIPKIITKIEAKSYVENFVVLNDYVLCNKANNPKPYFNVTNGQSFFYVPVSDLEILNKGEDNNSAMVYLSQILDKKKYTEYISSLSALAEEQKKYDEVDAKLNKLKNIFEVKGKDGLLIYDFSFPGDYGLLGFKIKVINTSKKKVKYAKFTIAGYNSVDDPVLTISGKQSVTFTGVGPIEKDNTASWSFEDIWRDNVFSYGRINSIKFEYFDGTIKTFTNVGKYVLDDDEIDFIELELK